MDTGELSPKKVKAAKTFPLSPHEYLTLKLCIGVFVPTMAGHLQSDASGFQLLIKLIGTHSFDQFVMKVPSPQELAINLVIIFVNACMVNAEIHNSPKWSNNILLEYLYLDIVLYP